MLAAGIGTVIGLMMGLTGAGSVLAVPLMMWLLGWPQAQAVPVALLSVFASATFGTIATWNVKEVRYKAASLMAIAGVPAITLGLYAAYVVPSMLLDAAFVVLLAVLAWHIWPRTGPPAVPSRHEPVCRLNPQTGRIIWTPVCAAAVAACGAITGFFAGLFGSGAGFFMTPALRAFSVLSVQSAVSTTLMSVALISASGLAILLLNGHSVPWPVALPFVSGALCGMFAGRRAASRLAGPGLQRVFAIVLMLMALRMVAGRLLALA